VVFERLGSLLKGNPAGYALGYAGEVTDEMLDNWLEVSASAGNDHLFPTRRFLAAIRNKELWKPHALKLSNVLAQQFEEAKPNQSVERYLNVYTALKKLHQSGGNDRAQAVLSVIADHLRGAVFYGKWNEIKSYPELQLLSKSGKWTSPRELAFPCAGIQSRALLHPDLAGALGFDGNNNNPNAGGALNVTPGLEISEQESSENLKRALTPFIQKLPSKAVGILPALLGNDTFCVRLAEDLLDGISVASIRDELIPPDVMVDDALGGTLRMRSEHWKFRVQLIQGSVVRLISITGDVFNAPLITTLESIFVPHPDGSMIKWKPGGVQVTCVADPAVFASFSEPMLQETLLESIRNILWWAYVHKAANLGVVFEKCSNLGQMSLGVAQQEILMSADTQLQLLGVRPPKLEPARLIAGEARARLAEAEAGVGDFQRLIQEGRDKELQARKLFRRIFDSSKPTQVALVGAIRRRIEQQQYEIDSIPLEILQNADDAATELLLMDLSADEQDLARRFVVVSDADNLCFFYGGRPINDTCGQTGKQGAQWRRDLVKMLLINGSDKNPQDNDTLTGKFGLGFKSVFLLSDCPQILSGNLAFEIVGGIWPRILPPEVAAQLKAQAIKWLGQHSRRTCIQLQGSPADQATALNRFILLAPWLPVFTHSLTTISIGREGRRTDYSWLPQQIDHSPRLHVGSIQDAESELRHIEFTDGKIQWLFRLKEGRLVAVPDYLPWLWVTAPTRERHLGFIVNGPFSLDPGRTRLSKHDEDVTGTNRNHFRKAADLFAEEFGKIFDKFDEISQTIGLDTPHSFWLSVWKLLTQIPHSPKIGGGEGSNHLSEALWHTEQAIGYSKLINSCRIIPNDLAHPMDTLASTATLKWAVTGWLGSSRGAHCMAIAIHRKLLPVEIPEDPSTYCSERIASELRTRLSVELGNLDLTSLIRKASGEQMNFVPALADTIATNLLFKEDGSPIEIADSLNPWETRNLMEIGPKLRFLTEIGTWELPDSLIMTSAHGIDTDESRRSEFAPNSRILSSQYSNKAARLFAAFRMRLQADSKQLVEWILDPESKLKLQKGLRYIAIGDLGEEVAFQLGPDWYYSIISNEAFFALDSATQQAIHIVFEKATKENELRLVRGQPGWDIPPKPAFEPPIEQPTLTVQEVLDCWDEATALRQFTVSGPLGRLVIPNSPDGTAILTHLQNPSTLQGKSAWYRLLSLGCTLGLPLGIRPLDLLKTLWDTELTEEFWQATIPESLENVTSKEFNQKLDSFFEKKIHMLFRSDNASGENAQFWRRVFYDFRKFHHLVFTNDLPETILQFASYEEADGPSLIGFLKSGRIPISIQDPNTPRFRGVIGQSMKAPLLFVMRELRRLGVLDERFDAASYYMNSPARRIARQLGWLGDETRYAGDFSDLVDQSEIVHRRMQDEIPELVGHFDLPLQLYAHKHRS
jgi:hypothetical protein